LTLLLRIPFLIAILVVNILLHRGWLPWSIIVPAIKAVPGLIMVVLLAFPCSSSHSPQPLPPSSFSVSASRFTALSLPSERCFQFGVGYHLGGFQAARLLRPTVFPSISSSSSLLDHRSGPLHPLASSTSSSSLPVSHFRLATCGCLQLRVPLSLVVIDRHRYLSCLPCIAARSFLRSCVGAWLCIVPIGVAQPCSLNYFEK